MESSGPACGPDASPQLAPARAILADAVAAYAHQLATLTGAFLVDAGVDREFAAQSLERAAERVRSGDASLRVDEHEPWIQLSDAVALWWRDPGYVDENGRPRPLPDAGPAPSLEDLFARTIAPALHERARELLRRKAATVRDDLWYYTGEYAVLRLGREEAVHRFLTELSGWMRTLLHNQALVDEPPHRRNFDSSAHVSDYPQSMLPELQAKLYRRAQLLLEEFDGYMTATAARGGDGPLVRVGVTAFMHTSPLATYAELNRHADTDGSAEDGVSADARAPASRQENPGA